MSGPDDPKTTPRETEDGGVPADTITGRLDPWMALSPLLVLLAALLCAVVIGGIVMVLTGANPVEAYWALLRGAVGSPDRIASSLARATRSSAPRLPWRSRSRQACSTSAPRGSC